MPGLGITIQLREGGTGGGNALCIQGVIKDGDFVGTAEPATNVDPTHTSDGTLVYSIRAQISTNDVKLRLGTNGDEQIFTDATHTNPMSIIELVYGQYAVILTWNATAKLYAGSSLGITETMNATVGSNYCMKVVIVPDLIIDYDFEEVL